jgi:hypothetical protein
VYCQIQLQEKEGNGCLVTSHLLSANGMDVLPSVRLKLPKWCSTGLLQTTPSETDMAKR